MARGLARGWRLRAVGGRRVRTPRALSAAISLAFARRLRAQLRASSAAAARDGVGGLHHDGFNRHGDHNNNGSIVSSATGDGSRLALAQEGGSPQQQREELLLLSAATTPEGAAAPRWHPDDSAADDPRGAETIFDFITSLSLSALGDPPGARRKLEAPRRAAQSRGSHDDGVAAVAEASSTPDWSDEQEGDLSSCVSIPSAAGGFRLASSGDDDGDDGGDGDELGADGERLPWRFHTDGDDACEGDDDDDDDENDVSDDDDEEEEEEEEEAVAARGAAGRRTRRATELEEVAALQDELVLRVEYGLLTPERLRDWVGALPPLEFEFETYGYGVPLLVPRKVQTCRVWNRSSSSDDVPMLIQPFFVDLSSSIQRWPFIHLATMAVCRISRSSAFLRT